MPKIDLKYLAKELNLAVSTVSRALRDEWDISADTRKRVQELAKKLDYTPNPYAGSLRRQSSQTIAVVIPEIANNFFTLAINGIESVAREKGYHVLIYMTHDEYEREVSIVKHFQNGRVDGIIMSVASGTTDYTHLLDMHEKEMPIVFFDRICNEIETTKITTDDFDSSFNTIRSSHSGMSALISRIGRGEVSRMRRSTPNVVSARNGGRPVHIAYNTLPRLKRSER